MRHPIVTRPAFVGWRLTTYGKLKPGDVCRFPDNEAYVSGVEAAGNGWVTVVLNGVCVDRLARHHVTVWTGRGGRER